VIQQGEPDAVVVRYGRYEVEAELGPEGQAGFNFVYRDEYGDLLDIIVGSSVMKGAVCAETDLLASRSS